MDNEEIRELLKELKESSDEGHTVKSRVVKIHFDTPKEAARKEQEKKKAEEEEARLRAEREEAEEKRRQEEAEAARKEAEAVVSQAKAEAAKSFVSDLDEELRQADEKLSEEEGTQSQEDDTALHFDWKMEKVRRPGDLLKELEEEDEPENEEPDGDGSAEESGEDGTEVTAESEAEPESGSVLDRAKAGFRSLGRRIAGAFIRMDQEDEREAGISAEEEKTDPSGSGEAESGEPMPGLDADAEGTEPENSGEAAGEEEPAARFSMAAGRKAVPASGAVEMHEISADAEPAAPGSVTGTEKGTGRPEGDEPEEPEDDWKRRMEEPPRYNLRGVKIPDMPVRPWHPASGKKQGTQEEQEKQGTQEEQGKQDDAGAENGASREESGQETAESGRTAGKTRPGAKRLWISADGEDLSEENFASDEDEFREAGAPGRAPEEDGKAERQERQTSSAAAFLMNFFAGVRSGRKARKPQGSAEDAAGTEQAALPEDSRESTAAEKGKPEAAEAAGGTQQLSGESVHGEDGLTEDTPDRRPENPEEEPQGGETAEGVKREADAAPSGLPGARKPSAHPQSIEVVNLNESANNRLVEVIDLDKVQTGPLPDLSAKDGGKNGGESSSAGRSKKGRTQDGEGGIAGFVRAHRTAVLITAAFLAALIAVLVLRAAMSGKAGTGQADGSSVTADEGLTIRIMEQPMSYVPSGQVRLSIQAPEDIQTITADGKTLDFSGGKKAEVTFTTSESTISLMVVCTDKVRNATVSLMYVDSVAPTVSAEVSDGTVTLSASDDLSGTAGIWYGTAPATSDVPLYQEYTGPFRREDGVIYSWYAEDRAGNRSVPETGTFVTAKSMAFSKAEYRLYSGSSTAVSIVTDPSDASPGSVTISSGDEDVVKVEQGNLLVPGKAGQTTLTASAPGLQDATAAVKVSDSPAVTVTAVGDCTLGTDPTFNTQTSFNAYQTLYGDSYFFDNVRDYLSQDDATIANLEGALTDSTDRQNKTFTFSGDPSYTAILLDGSVEAVTLANNHSGDYGEQGLTDTENALDDAGIVWCGGDTIGYQQIGGVKVAFIGIYAVENGLESLDQVKSTVAQARENGASVIVADFHWNSELVENPNDDMVTLGHAAVDAGADLVVGSHSHTVSGIEQYNGKYIVYGLGNFVFGGNTSPADYDAMMFRQTFTVTADGTEDDDSIEIVPVSVSSQSGFNNYQPRILTGDEAQQVMDKINARSEQFGQTWDAYLSDGGSVQ